MKTRGLGRVYQPTYTNRHGIKKQSAVWWIQYSFRGKVYRESSQATDRPTAVRLLGKRLGEIGRGKLVGPQEDRVTFEELAADLVRDYEVRGLRSLEALRCRLTHLRLFFDTSRALDITAAGIREYQAARREEGASGGTVNREVAILGRMFSLAVKAERLTTRPTFPAPLNENPPREGFFEHPEYLAVRQHLIPDHQDVLDFAYYSGWRRREITGLIWPDVDLDGGVTRLSPGRSKSQRGRVLPLSAPLRDVLLRRLAARRLDTLLVFHREGQPIRDRRKRWGRACRLAGLPGKRLHDCRRTVVRNLTRAGVPEKVAMTMTGHESRDVFDRYDIVNERDLKRAADALVEYVKGQPATPTVIPMARAAKGAAR